MRKFVMLQGLVDNEDAMQSRVKTLRLALLAPVVCKLNIQQTLQKANFNFHRTCSFINFMRDCNVAQGETLMIYCRAVNSQSKATMSASSCSSLPISINCPNVQVEKELRSVLQQTEISCRLNSPVPDDGRVFRSLLNSFSFSSPASSLLNGTTGNARSVSILSSVCALLLSKQNSTAKEVPSPTGSRNSEQICRICFGGCSTERLVRPCGCRGTVAAVHRSCLERWLLQAATSHCELCRHHYAVTRTHKWSRVRALVEWLRAGRGRLLWHDLWRAGSLGAASVLGTARALHLCDAALQAGARRGGSAALAANLFSSLLIGVIGALNGLLTTWMLLKIQEHQLSWQAWRDSTLHVHVSLPVDETCTTEPTYSPEVMLSPRPSDRTVVALDMNDPPRVDRSTNVADPFMVALPCTMPDS